MSLRNAIHSPISQVSGLVINLQIHESFGIARSISGLWGDHLRHFVHYGAALLPNYYDSRVPSLICQFRSQSGGIFPQPCASECTDEVQLNPPIKDFKEPTIIFIIDGSCQKKKKKRKKNMFICYR